MMTYSIFDAGRIGPLLELEQSGTVLTVADVADINRTALALQPQSVGRWYAELLMYGTGDLLASIGIAQAGASLNTYVGGDALGYGYRLDLGQIHTAGASVASVAPAAKGDMIGVLLDLTTSTPTVTWYRNGTLVNTQMLPSTGPWALAASLGGSEPYGLRCFLNAGQRAFEFAPDDVDGWYQPSTSIDGLRLASEDWLSDPTDVVPNVRYSGALDGTGTELRAVRSLDFWPWQRGIKTGAMTLTALDDGSFAELLASDARDLPVRIGQISRGQSYADRAPLFSAVIDNVSAVDDLQIKLTCRDPLALLDVPLQRWLIRPDADPSSANQPRPILLGACRNVPCVILDATTYTYAVADAPLLGIGFGRDKGYPYDPAATPPDFTLAPNKLNIVPHAQPQGVVTIDASSVGGQQLPTPSDDILHGTGNPPIGTDGSAPDGMTTGGDTAPVMSGGKIVFPQVSNSATIRVAGTIATSNYTGVGTPGACVRISWRDASGIELSLTDSTRLTGTHAAATYTAQATAPAGAKFAVLEFAAYGHTGGTATFSAPKAWYVMPDDSLVSIPILNPGLIGAGGWSPETSAQGNLFTGFDGSVIKNPDTVSTSPTVTSRALRNNYLALDVPSTTGLGWLKLTSATKYGAGKSYLVDVTIPDLPAGFARIALATNTTVDSVIASWSEAGTYTLTLTNNDGVDHDLYLLGVPLVPGAMPVPPSIGAIQVIAYDDTYTPDPRDTTPATLQAIKLADYLHQVLDVRATQAGVSWSIEDAQSIDTVTGYAGIGVYLAGGETIATALDMALASYTACKWCDAAGVLRFARLIAPEDMTPAGTIDVNAMDGDLVPALDTAPGLTTQMGVRRNWASLSDGDLVVASLNFPLAVRQSMLRQYQQVASTAQPLAGAYQHALYAAPVASCFDQQADGQAEIDRVAAIYTVPRWFYTVTVELTALPGLDLGQVWTLTYPKYGLAAGKPVMIIDYEPDLLANTANIILWG